MPFMFSYFTLCFFFFFLNAIDIRNSETPTTQNLERITILIHHLCMASQNYSKSLTWPTSRLLLLTEHAFLLWGLYGLFENNVQPSYSIYMKHRAGQLEWLFNSMQKGRRRESGIEPNVNSTLSRDLVNNLWLGILAWTQ